MCMNIYTIHTNVCARVATCELVSHWLLISNYLQLNKMLIWCFIYRRWFPKEYETTRYSKKELCDHRALPDIMRSIEELKYYKQNIFRGHEVEDAMSIPWRWICECSECQRSLRFVNSWTWSNSDISCY